MSTKTASRSKVSITLDPSVLDRIKAEVGPRGVSEWVNEASLLRLQGQSFARLRSELGVVISEEVAAKVEAEWPADA